MKKELKIFLAILVSNIILYLFTENDFAIFLIIISVVYMVLSFISITASNKKITLDIEEYEGAKKTRERIFISAQNNSYVPILRYEVKVFFKNSLTEELIEGVVDTSLNPRRKKIIDVKVPDMRCGLIEAAISQVSVKDTFGLFEKLWTEDNNVEYIIVPKIVKLNMDDEELSQFDMESYKYSSVKKGEDLSEIFGIREYTPGDSIRGIHWKLSGKFGHTMVKIPSFPIESSFMLILDKRFDGKNFDLIEKTTELFLSLSYTLVNKDYTYSMGWYDYCMEKFVYKKISSNEDFSKAVIDLLSTPFRKDSGSVAEYFLNSYTEENFTSYIYVTNSDIAEKEVEQLREYGEVKIYKPNDFI
ncbi:MAG: DUF58 domain-containing protein [Anaerovoracaceae bacterium]|nr:DUF58 domain-containing protein [Anaerovoracaceae bacterium]